MAVASSPSGDMIATSCKATSAEHAVIRLYETATWQQILPPLAGHTLTITRIVFSPDGQYILSCSRDRTWRLFRKKEGELGMSHIVSPTMPNRLFRSLPSRLRTGRSRETTRANHLGLHVWTRLVLLCDCGSRQAVQAVEKGGFRGRQVGVGGDGQGRRSCDGCCYYQGRGESAVSAARWPGE
jgi:hypothetical protein